MQILRKTKKQKYLFLVTLFIFAIHLVSARAVFSAACVQDDPCKDIAEIEKKISCYEEIKNACSAQRQNLTSQIVYFTTQIELTETRIIATKNQIKKLQEEIEDLTDKIEDLEASLTKFTGMLIDRIRMVYKYGNSSYFNLLLSSRRFSDMLNRYKYIQTVQNHNKDILVQLQNSKFNFKDQKDLREEKTEAMELARAQLEKEEKKLEIQKREQEVFLEVTKKSEKVYQQNLEAARKEAQEIQKAASLLSKAGVPRKVNRGDTIGIMGNSGFSTGPHLHFAVYNLNEADLDKFNFESGYDNPLNYLQSRELPFVANSCDDIGENTTRTVGSGSWSWPMSSPTMTQCYGHTPYSAAYYRSGIHNGIDMYDDSDTLIKAVESGNAYTYRGGQSAGNGVFIFHDNGKMTLYWHLQ